MSVNPKASLAKLIFTHDESIDTPLSITNQNGTFYYHRDHQGSIVALTDSAGAVVESFTYDNHYGTITNHTKDVETNNPYAYTGRELDTNELYYYRARYYDPQIQRFISEDPIGFVSGDFNWYRYVWNSPLNLTDPLGLSYLDIDIRTDPNDPKKPWDDPDPKPKTRDSCCDWYPWIDGNESTRDILDLEKNWNDCCRKKIVLPVCE